jgi:DNA-binding transcriptional MerR regulator
MSLSIGRVVERSGVAATTLRFYEAEGLLTAPGRVGGRRRYDEGVFHRLEVIGLCKAAGFSLDEIRVLLSDDTPGRSASRSLAEAKLTDVDAQLATLIRARAIIEWAMDCPDEPLSGSPC